MKDEGDKINNDGDYNDFSWSMESYWLSLLQCNNHYSDVLLPGSTWLRYGDNVLASLTMVTWYQIKKERKLNENMNNWIDMKCRQRSWYNYNIQ